MFYSKKLYFFIAIKATTKNSFVEEKTAFNSPKTFLARQAGKSYRSFPECRIFLAIGMTCSFYAYNMTVFPDAMSIRGTHGYTLIRKQTKPLAQQPNTLY